MGESEKDGVTWWGWTTGVVVAEENLDVVGVLETGNEETEASKGNPEASENLGNDS
jgi:hypothetical protein